MTDLQVAQPLFDLILHSMFLLRATTPLAIGGPGVERSRLSCNNQTRGRIVAGKRSEQTNQMRQHHSSLGIMRETSWTRFVSSSMLINR